MAELTKEEKIEVLKLFEEKQRRIARRKIFSFYPDTGPLRRELYQKHLMFFRLGNRVKTRAFVAANRVGKSEGSGGYEVTMHLTGLYPDWWEGYRFEQANHWWAAGDTKETVRDIVQMKLLGPEGSYGTGLIPFDNLGKIRMRQNGNGAVDTVEVRHISGAVSTLGFKSYDQGRESFQGTEKDGIWLDEESNEGIRSECIIRLMTTQGLLLETFTPLRGITPIISKYFGDAVIDDSGLLESDDRAVVMAGWDDVPHLSSDDKKRMMAESESHLRDARSKGIPSLGSGAIYPVPEEDILVDPFEIPAFWPKAYALDVGWNRTAALWGALNPDTNVLYLYDEYYRGQAEPVIHASAIKQRGAWIPGEIDPAARGRAQTDGRQLLKLYKDEGLTLFIANNEVEAGIYNVWQALSTGKIKVFKALMNFRSEYRMYRRDENGKIVKKNDHLCDCLRYLFASKMKHARTAVINQVWLPKTEPLDPIMNY